MKYLFITLIYLFSINNSFAFNQTDPVTPEHQALVRGEVERAFSQGWDDDVFDFSPCDDIWSLLYEDSNEMECLAVVTGLAEKPDYSGTQTHRFRVCLSLDPDGELEAELWESQPDGD